MMWAVITDDHEQSSFCMITTMIIEALNNYQIHLLLMLIGQPLDSFWTMDVTLGLTREKKALFNSFIKRKQFVMIIKINKKYYWCDHTNKMNYVKNCCLVGNIWPHKLLINQLLRLLIKLFTICLRWNK